jgi:hypothetical protein
VPLFFFHIRHFSIVLIFLFCINIDLCLFFANFAFKKFSIFSFFGACFKAYARLPRAAKHPSSNVLTLACYITWSSMMGSMSRSVFGCESKRKFV